MAGEAGDFHDWELLHDSSESDSVISSDSFKDLEGFEGESQGMIQADYFSLDNNNCLKINSSGHGSVESDNRSWIVPELEARCAEPHELWSEMGTDRSDDYKFGKVEAINEMGFVENGKTLVGFEGIREISSPENELGLVGNGKTLEGFEGVEVIDSPKNELSVVGTGKTLVGCNEIGEIGSEDEFSLTQNNLGFVGNGENETSFEQSFEFSKIGHGSEVGKGIVENSDVGENLSPGENEVPSGEQSHPPMEVVKAASEGEKKCVVWWKVPFELLRFCAFRVSPVWTFSMAAAVMGVIILTRRLYMMKKKSQSLHLKVAMNDKKVSQFMSRAARLNEAFSVVKRVPVIRPALPAAGGLTHWPVINLR